MLNKYEIDVLLDGLQKGTTDSDSAITAAQNAIAKDVADLNAINESLAQKKWPATAKLNDLKTQQDSIRFSPDEKNLLDRLTHEATLKSLESIQKDYATAGANAPVEIKQRIEEIKHMLDHMPAITPSAERDAWQSLSDHNPRAKYHADMIGKEQARAIWTAATNKLRLQKISELKTKLDQAAKETNPDDKKNAVTKSLHELKKVAHEQTATQRKEKEVSAIIDGLQFNAQLDSKYQGTEKIPDELIELQNIIANLKEKQNEINTLCDELDSRPVVGHRELLNQIDAKKQESKELAYKLNAWLVKHENSHLLAVTKEVADDILQRNKHAMYARGYQPPTFSQRVNKRDYVHLPTRESIPQEENLAHSYKDVTPGAYGGIFKLNFWEHRDIQRPYPSIRDTVYIDMSEVTLPLYGKPHSLQEVLINLYGPVDSENFKNHATCHGPNRIRLHWENSAALQKMLTEIKNADKAHKDAVKNNVKITEKPGKDDSDTDVHASLPSP